MSLSTETLFTTALGLQSPSWQVKCVERNTARFRIGSGAQSNVKRLSGPCGCHADQDIHDRVRKSWRQHHQDIFRCEECLHVGLPRVVCTASGKAILVPVPCVDKEGCAHLTLLFEALALLQCKEKPVAQGAKLLREQGYGLWLRIGHYDKQACAVDDMSLVRHIGVDETSLKKELNHFIAAHDQQAKRLQFVLGRDRHVVLDYTPDLQANGRKPEKIDNVCMTVQIKPKKVTNTNLNQWILWVSRAKLEPFKRLLVNTLKTHWDGAKVGMSQQDGTDTYVDAMNRLSQQAKLAAHEFRNTRSLITIANLHMSKLATCQRIRLKRPGHTAWVSSCMWCVGKFHSKCHKANIFRRQRH